MTGKPIRPIAPESSRGAPAAGVGRRERGKEEKRARIKAAARALFAEKGFAATTTQEIAARADIGTGTLFLYAHTKEELLVLVFRDEMDRVSEEAFASLPRRQSLLGKLMHVYGSLLQFHDRDQDLARVFVKEVLFVRRRTANRSTSSSRVSSVAPPRSSKRRRSAASSMPASRRSFSPRIASPPTCCACRSGWASATHWRPSSTSSDCGVVRASTSWPRAGAEASRPAHQSVTTQTFVSPKETSMAARTGEQFLKGLRDDRAIWVGSERVRDVADHPAFSGAARAMAALFDLQHEAADVCLMPDPETGRGNQRQPSHPALARRPRSPPRVPRAARGVHRRPHGTDA